MLQALAGRGARPDLLVGTSVAAVNAAWVAEHGLSVDSPAGLALSALPMLAAAVRRLDSLDDI